MNSLYYFRRTAVLFLISCALFLAGNNLISLTDPDEVFYSLTAKEMSAKNEWMTPVIFGQPQFEKPPLTYWLIEFAFKTWGESPFTARLFPAVFACLGVLALYWLGCMVFREERKAFLSALVLATSMFYAAMGKMVFTDMIFSVLILCAFSMFMLALTDRRRQGIGIVGFYVFCGLATLAKSPLGFFIPQLAVVLFLLYQRQLKFLLNPWIPAGISVYMIIALPWYVYMFDQFGQAFIHEFFYNDHWRRLMEAEHHGNDHWFFYPMTMIAGLFPWSLFLIAALVDLFKRLKSSVTAVDYLSLSWIFSVLLVFQAAHSKLASYILPLFPALALMTGHFLGDALSHIQYRPKMQRLSFGSFVLLAVLGAGVMGAQKFVQHYIPSTMPLFFLSGSLITLAGLGITLVIKERFQPALYVLALAVVPVFSTAFLVESSLEGYVSSYEASQYIPRHDWGAMTVLTSKFNARGIHFYTGQEVAVLDYSGKPFFSPHPIAILDTTDKVESVLASQKVTFGVLRKNAYNDILKNCSNRYHIVLLKAIGFDYIVRIEALKHS